MGFPSLSYSYPTYVPGHTRKIHKVKDVRDIWADEPKKSSKSKANRTIPSLRKAATYENVDKPNAGLSYNPEDQDYQKAVKKVTKRLLAEEHRFLRDEKFFTIPEEEEVTKTDKIESKEEPIEPQPQDEENVKIKRKSNPLPKKKKKKLLDKDAKKELLEYNREVKGKKRTHGIEKIDKILDNVLKEKKKAENFSKRKRNARTYNEPVLSPNEISRNLRKQEIDRKILSPITDRFRSFYARKMLSVNRKKKPLHLLEKYLAPEFV
eukprot:NODE_6377_length_892_cov_30.039012_g5785_i0.p1 GENE.NODE_6377_length_892_cov_30.039012_g5785_i0~~NODE_6377_length_892_cov_30.039012_g5785_i0.p1  ORF type:complete len:276 (-),score=46.00 NODE_6377_length_892_cov_30.039012_g5785_i0:64-858(-)